MKTITSAVMEIINVWIPRKMSATPQCPYEIHMGSIWSKRKSSISETALHAHLSNHGWRDQPSPMRLNKLVMCREHHVCVGEFPGGAYRDPWRMEVCAWGNMEAHKGPATNGNRVTQVKGNFKVRVGLGQ